MLSYSFSCTHAQSKVQGRIAAYIPVPFAGRRSVRRCGWTASRAISPRNKLSSAADQGPEPRNFTVREIAPISHAGPQESTTSEGF